MLDLGERRPLGLLGGPLLMPTPTAQLKPGALIPTEIAKGLDSSKLCSFFFFSSIYPFPKSYLSCCLWAGKKVV